MIQDGVDYGEGYERAYEAGPDVECSVNNGYTWDAPTDFNTTKSVNHIYINMQKCAEQGNRYRQPIKPKPLKLQAGERYRMRNGEIVDDLTPYSHPTRVFYSEKHKWYFKADGLRGYCEDGEREIIEHIPPKEQSMSEKMIRVNASKFCTGSFEAYLTIDEAIRAGDEAKRIMEESNKIRIGDYIIYRGAIRIVSNIIGDEYTYADPTGVSIHKKTKITNPAHIQALTEIYEANK
jgi:hypothetical protein